MSLAHNRRPKDHIFAETRYLHYYLIFPGDNDQWQDCFPFTGPISKFIENTALYKKDPDIARNVLKNGTHHWKDRNGVTHRIVIAEKPINRVWGTQKKKLIL